MSSFNTISSDIIAYIFRGCTSLLIINFKKLTINNNVFMDEMFLLVPSNAKFCIDNMAHVNSKLGTSYTSSCSDNCFQNDIKLEPEQNICIESCEETTYKYEYNNICYNTCPLGTHPTLNNEFLCTDKNPIGYYFDEIDSIYHSCYKSCKTCYGQGDSDNNNCIECKYYYYYNEVNKYYCTESKICPEISNKLIKEKNKCVSDCSKDDYFQYEYNNICYTNCPNRIYNNNFICIDCDIKCSSCSLESAISNLCINCNEGYYPIYKITFSEFKNCSKDPEGFYLDNDLFYKSCYNSCKICNISGTESFHNCLQCKDDYKYQIIYRDYKNCYINCSYYYYTNKTTNISYCTKEEKCPDIFNKLIENKRECIDSCNKDKYYKYEFHKKCYIDCPINTTRIEKKIIIQT